MSNQKRIYDSNVTYPILEIIAAECNTKHIRKNKNGLFHNENGPAMITEKGTTFWILEGKMCRNFEEWCKVLGKTDEEIVQLKLKYNTKK